MAFWGNRFRHRTARGKGLPPLAIAGICLAVAVALTVTVGNLLRLWLDDDTYLRLTGGKDEPETGKEFHNFLTDVHAYPFILGSSAEIPEGKPAVSVSLNTPEGALLYTSPVAQYLGIPNDQSVLLNESMDVLSAFTSRICGVFYPQAFGQELSELRYTVRAEESALLREFILAGGSEILLVGLPVEADTAPEVLEYIRAIREVSGDASLGVAVPLQAAASGTGWELLGNLLKVCDFCALDVRDADPAESEELLKAADYYLKQYDMRLLLTESQTALIDAAEAAPVADFQIVSTPPEKAEKTDKIP